MLAQSRPLFSTTPPFFSINKLRQEQCKFNVVKLSYHAEICACGVIGMGDGDTADSPKGKGKVECSHMSTQDVIRNATRSNVTLATRYAYLYSLLMLR